MAERLPKTFTTDYGVEGPHPPPIVIPWWLIPLGLLFLFFIGGAIGARLNLF